LGGGIGGQILSAVSGLGAASGASAGGGMLSSAAGGGIGGIVLTVIMGIIKNMMAKKSRFALGGVFLRSAWRLLAGGDEIDRPGSCRP